MGNGVQTTGAKKNIVDKKEADKSVVDIVTEKVHEFMRSGQLDLPKDYSVENALKFAYLALHTVENKDNQKIIVDGKLTGVCTTASIANALLDMIVQGLDPNKDQVYFLVYGKMLSAQRSYFGSMAVAERVNLKIKDWGYGVVYQGDEFKYGIKNGKKSVIDHVQDFENINNDKILGAYAMALDKDGNPITTEIMTIEQIHQSWKQSPMRPFDDQGKLKASSMHAKFPADFSLRTVINKLAKFLINSSSDNALLLERINRSEEMADAAAVQVEIQEKANRGSVIMIPEDAKDTLAEEQKAEAPKTEPPPQKEIKPEVGDTSHARYCGF